MKAVSELEGFDLDYWAAMAVCWGDGEGQGWFSDGTDTLFPGWVRDQVIIEWMPHRRWEDGGPLIGEHRVSLSPLVADEFEWSAACQKGRHEFGVTAEELGDTPLEAACRAIVASVYGDYVPEGGDD